MLDKLSCDAVEPDQLAQLHDIDLSQPLRLAQGSGGAEVEWWKLESLVKGVLASISSALQFVLFDGKLGFSTFRRITFCKPRTHQLPLTQSPSNIDERFDRLVIAKFR